jgi:hypothetical protein
MPMSFAICQLSLNTCNYLLPLQLAPIRTRSLSRERLNEISQAGDLVERLAGVGLTSAPGFFDIGTMTRIWPRAFSASCGSRPSASKSWRSIGRNG